MSEILPPEQRLDDDLVQLCLELYARTFAYPDSKELHESAFEAIKVLKDRLAYRRGFMSELNSAADVYRPAAPDDSKQSEQARPEDISIPEDIGEAVEYIYQWFAKRGIQYFDIGPLQSRRNHQKAIEELEKMAAESADVRARWASVGRTISDHDDGFYGAVDEIVRKLRPLLIEAPDDGKGQPVALKDAQIKHMVDRFLGWRLPENFNPDAGISFKPTFNDHLPIPMKHEPIGTNLFDAAQADAMVRYMVEGMQAPQGWQQGAAREIVLAVDKVSEAMKGPRFTFIEFQNEIEAILKRHQEK